MKIFIFGPPGSGKTTLAKRLSEKLSISHFDLDAHFFKFEQGGDPLAPKRHLTIQNFLKEEKWIIEGMYLDSWLDEVLKHADHIFIINPPKLLNIYRLSKRTLKRIIKIETYERKSDLKVLTYLLKQAVFFNKRREEIKKRANTFGKTIIERKWKSEIYKYLNTKNS